MGGFHFRDATADDEPAIRAVVFSVLEEFGLSPDPDSADADLQDIVASYIGTGGAFRVLVSPSGEVVGCGGLYPIDREDVELRKMYFLESARGRGLGTIFLHDLIDRARRLGFGRIVIETASVLEAAIALYGKNGFVPLQRERLTCRCDQAYVLTLNADGSTPTVVPERKA